MAKMKVWFDEVAPDLLFGFATVEANSPWAVFSSCPRARFSGSLKMRAQIARFLPQAQ